jgi:hypothetical protein
MSTSDSPPPAADEATSDTREEAWAYGGVRMLNGKRAHAWLRDAGPR